MEQSPWEADSPTGSLENPWLVSNPKIHYRFHNSLTLDSILIQINPVHNPKPYIFKSDFNIILSFTFKSSKCSQSPRIFW